jgi:exodeoxyribonuclease VII large subunit
VLFAENKLFTVSELNALVRTLIEDVYADVAVLGEVSNFKRHTSGHLYFTLKDADAQIRTVCFRGDAERLTVEIADGMKLVACGRLTLYEPYGQYQIVAREVHEAGEGELERAFLALKDRLEREGLFDATRKKPLPKYPMRIAVVTSPTGAAIRDILSTLKRRWPCAEVLLFPVHVQGREAAPEIARALDRLPSAGGIEVAIVGRGGGSLEDLWAFNEEEVARAIYRCPLPVISAVGHETDFTIADFVADVRAATPTMAAEIAVPDRGDVLDGLDAKIRWLCGYMDNRLHLQTTRLRELLRSYALGKVRGRIESSMQTLDYLADRLTRSVQNLVRGRRVALEGTVSKLQALSPREILSRGYTICTSAATGAVLKRVDEAVAARLVRITFQDGSAQSEVKERSNEG